MQQMMASQADIESLRREIEQLRAENAALRAETERLYRIVEDEVWNEDVQKIKREKVDPTEKDVFQHFRKLWPDLPKNEYGLAERPDREIAAKIGISLGRVQAAFRRGKKMDLFTMPAPEPKIVRSELTGKPLIDERTGKPQYTSKSWIAPSPIFDDPDRWEVPVTIARKPSGHHPRRAPIPTCPICGEPATNEHAILHCTNNHEWIVDTDFEADDAEDQVDSPEDDELAAIWESESAEDQVDSPKYVIDDQVDVPPQQDEPITAAHASLDWHATLSAELQKRLGERIICATGKLVQNQKYYTQPEGYIPDMAAYLRGDPEHIYGSRLLLSTGLSWLIEYDFDDKQPEHDEHHKIYMRRLADAGIASLYSVRRDKRGHLAIPFTVPVDPQAAYAWVNSIVPELATVNECYPVNGVEDKRNEPLSWPFYQRIGSQVTECKVEVMYPAAPGHLYASKGIVSEPEKLAGLLRRCVTDASLVPARKVEETQRYAGGLLEKPLPRSAWEDDLIDAFNRSHSWDWIADMCGGFSRTGHFKAVWRGERTASVKPDGPDSRYACDYGNHGSYPKKVDRYGAYCLIKGINEHDDLKARREAMRKVVAA